MTKRSFIFLENEILNKCKTFSPLFKSIDEPSEAVTIQQDKWQEKW